MNYINPPSSEIRDCRDFVQSVGWVERSETQLNQQFVGFRCLNPTYRIKGQWGGFGQ